MEIKVCGNETGNIFTQTGVAVLQGILLCNLSATINKYISTNPLFHRWIIPRWWRADQLQV